MQFTVLSLSALPHNMLRVFTMCSLCAQCAATSQRTRRGLHASSLDLSLCLYCDYVGCLSMTTELQWCSWRPYHTYCHGNHILFLQHVYQNAEPPLFCASQRMLNGILWDPTITDEDATALLHRCRRLYQCTSAFYFHGHSRMALRT